MDRSRCRWFARAAWKFLCEVGVQHVRERAFAKLM
jgi:hypothetical protein